MERPLSIEPQIIAYFHCRKCLQELPDGQSPAEWADNAVGYTAEGIQVWCNRHKVNVANFKLDRETSEMDSSDEGLFE